MKNYIIFGYNITGIGGAQLYYKNRISYLESIGYKTSIFSGISGKVEIDYLKKYDDFIINELDYLPSSFSKDTRRKVIYRIIHEINTDGSFLIESVGGNPTIWAELFADVLHARHICFNVAETQSVNCSNSILDYYYFKYKRGELYGINKSSLTNLFKNRYVVPTSQEYTFSPVCTNVVEDTVMYENIFPKSNFNIGGIWRTNKYSFLVTMDELYRYFISNSNFNYNLIIIGSGSKDNEKLIGKLFSSLSNVKLFILGYLYPIPKNLLESIDVFVCTAGSTRVPAYCGRPSIAVTVDLKNKLYPLGIFNYTTLNTNIPEETGKTLSDYLNMVLIDRFCSNHDVLDKELLHHGDVVKKNEDQMKRFNSNVPYEYYDVLKIRPQTFKEKVNAFLCKTIGVYATSKLRPSLHRLNNAFRRGK